VSVVLYDVKLCFRRRHYIIVVIINISLLLLAVNTVQVLRVFHIRYLAWLAWLAAVHILTAVYTAHYSTNNYKVLTPLLYIVALWPRVTGFSQLPSERGD
jgi:phosphatidylserine synthase